jgi:hypothetical protein
MAPRRLVKSATNRHFIGMALLPPMYTTNKAGTPKPRSKKSKALLKAEAEHARFLKRMGVGDPGRKIVAPAREPAYARPSPDIPSLNSRGEVPTKPEPKVYRGQRKLLGVATMHKSNMVPVFADNPEEAVEIAKMRR